MRRFVGTLLDIIILSVVVLGIIALWGLLPTESRDELPVTVKVTQGKASALLAGERNERTIAGLMSLNPGSRVRVPAGGDAFLLFPDGSISRTTGPSEVVIEESTRTMKKPAVLTRIVSMIRKSASQPPDEVNIVVKVRVVRGEVVTKVAPLSSRNSGFHMKAPATFVSAGGASFILKVQDNGETSIEVGKGPVSVAMVSAGERSLVPVVIPELASSKGIVKPALPVDRARPQEVDDILSHLETALPLLSRASGAVSVEGIDFREVRSGEIPHFVGERREDTQLRTFNAQTSPPASTATIEKQTTIPGAQTFALSDRDLGSNLPPPFPPDTKINILAGNAVKVNTGDLTVVATLSAVDGRLEIRGLPFDLNPSQVSQAVTDYMGTGGQSPPAFLSVSSIPGQLNFAYARDIVAPVGGVSRSPDSTDIEPPPNLPHTAEYFKTIPTPREVSTDWKVVSSNFFLAGLITYLISVFAGFANNVVKKKESYLSGFVSKTGLVFGKVIGWRGRKGRLKSWFATARLTRAVLIMFLFGALYSFLSSGKGLFGPGGLVVFLTLSLTTGFFALYDPWVRSFFARRMKITAKVALYPGQIFIAFISLLISRLLVFKPGLMLGAPGGLAMPEGEPDPKQKLKLSVVSLVAIAVLGGAAWIIVFLMPAFSQQRWAQGFFQTAPGVASWIQDWGLAAFAMAGQRIFFELLPLPSSTGREILRKNLIAWGIPFLVALFIFMHTQINKQRNVMDLTPQVYITLAIAIILGGAAQIYNLRQSAKDRKAASATNLTP